MQIVHMFVLKILKILCRLLSVDHASRRKWILCIHIHVKFECCTHISQILLIDWLCWLWKCGWQIASDRCECNLCVTNELAWISFWIELHFAQAHVSITLFFFHEDCPHSHHWPHFSFVRFFFSPTRLTAMRKLIRVFFLLSERKWNVHLYKWWWTCDFHETKTKKSEEKKLNIDK